MCSSGCIAVSTTTIVSALLMIVRTAAVSMSSDGDGGGGTLAVDPQLGLPVPPLLQQQHQQRNEELMAGLPSLLHDHHHHQQQQRQQQHRSCERVVVPMCMGVGYNYTLMPNAMGHESQQEAIDGLRLFNSFLDHKCSQFSRLFVCSVFVPFCSEHLPGTIPPCRGLCENVKKDCLPALQRIGLNWPEQLSCNRFPSAPDLCLQPPNDDGGPFGLEPDMHIKHKFQLPSQPSQHMVRCPVDTVASGDRCLNICGSQNENYSQEDRFLSEIWIAVWSILSLLLTSFALLTFLIQPGRFRWPARPVLYLCTCGLVISSLSLIHWAVGPYTCSNNSQDNSPSSSSASTTSITTSSLLSPSRDNSLCIGTALLTVYFQAAFAAWYLVLTYVWYLSAAREWSTEAIERISTRFHHGVWSASLIPVIYTLFVDNAIVLSDVTGVCSVRSSLITAGELSVVLAGVFLTIVTVQALQNVRRTLQCAGRSPYKLERLIYRLAVISFGVAICLGISQCSSFGGGGGAPLVFEMVKIAGFVSSVSFASLWVVSGKTFRSWNRVLRPAFLMEKGMTPVPVTKV